VKKEKVHPIRLATKPIFVYAQKKNHSYLKKNLKTISMSQFVDRLLTFMRTGETDFQNLIPAIEGTKQYGPHKKFKTPFTVDDSE